MFPYVPICRVVAKPQRRAFANCRIKNSKTRLSRRVVPLQAKAVEALDRLPAAENPILFANARGGRIDFRIFGRRHWRPAQIAAGIEPIRGLYDLQSSPACARAGRCGRNDSRQAETSEDCRVQACGPADSRPRQRDHQKAECPVDRRDGIADANTTALLKHRLRGLGAPSRAQKRARGFKPSYLRRSSA